MTLSKEGVKAGSSDRTKCLMVGVGGFSGAEGLIATSEVEVIDYVHQDGVRSQ